MSHQPPEIGKSIAAMGLKTNFHEAGEGPPVVLLHGSGPGVSAWANWRLTMPELAKNFRVIAVDLAGYGFTELDPKAVYTMDYWLEHLKAFLDALKLDKVMFLGNSFGGLLAAHFALRHPERVKRIACMGSNLLTFPIGHPLDQLAWGYSPSLENMRRLLEVFPFDKSIINDAMVESRFQASNRPGYREAYASMYPAPRQKVVDELALSPEKLAQLQCEMLLVHGREDALVPIDVSIRAQAIIPKSQLHTFGRCGHWVQIEHASAFVSLLQTFFGAE